VLERPVTRSEWPSRRAIWWEPPPTRPPKPASAASAERLQRAVRIEDLDRGAGQRMNVVDWLTARCGARRCHHAALSVGWVSAKPRRYSAALDAWLQAVKNARLSAFRSSIHEAM